MDAESARLLRDASRRITPEDFSARQASAKDQLQLILDSVTNTGVLEPVHLRMLSSAFSRTRPGSFRLRPKIHKPCVKGRPVFNLTCCWIQPLSTFLVGALKPLQDSVRFALNSSDSLIAELAYIGVEPDDVIFTGDLQNLYPSLDHDDLLLRLRSRIMDFFQRSRFAYVVADILELVMTNQVVAFKSSLHLIVQGIGTGLSPGVMIANIYLDSLDSHIFQHLPTQGHGIKLYRRFVDDLLLIMNRHLASRVKQLVDNYLPNVIIDDMRCGTDSVSYLDLSLGIDGRKLTWQLYNKPLAKYLYVPANSAHPRRIFQGIVEGLVHRCLRKCKHQRDALKYISLYVRRCQDRGYNPELIRAAVERQMRKHRKQSLGFACARPPRAKHASFYVKYTSDLNSNALRRVLGIFPSSRRPRLAMGVQRNLFRLLHVYNWPR